MKKKSILLLSFLLILSFIYLNRIFSTSNHYVNTFESFKALAENTNIDVLFFGSSHAYTAFNPLIIDKESKTVSFNLGSDALRVPFTDLIIEEALKKTNPELIVIEIYPPSIPGPENDLIKGYQLRALDMISNFSLKKQEKIERFYTNKELAGVYFPLIRNHNKWNEMKYFKLSRKENFNENTTFFNNGYIGFNTVIDSLGRSKFNGFKEIIAYPEHKKTKIDETGKRDIVELIRVAKSQGSQVLVVSSPDLRAKFDWSESFLDDLKNICEQQEINYLNLNNHYNEMGLNIIDFRDPSHLNIQGAIKTSKYLSSYINKNYKLKDRSSEPIWDSMNKIYIGFNERNKTASFQKQLKFNFIKEIQLKMIEMKILNNKLNAKIYIDKTNYSKRENKKYSISLKIFPYNIDELSDYSKSRNWDFDKVDIKLKDKDSILNFQLNSKIKEVKQLELFLFNSEQYKGVVGEKLVLKNIEFQ
ncbi:MAG: hypothetical protein KDC67_02040 [Ignavibacteriae bacterium]|uniref:hypothetical protein n=1 Tax=Galbibacter sp. TaxID=2918471 RepID=UPI001E14FD1D|nr:hypothetical protein [Ignavibacteriota bacterium]